MKNSKQYMKNKLSELAEQFAKHFHEGQYRKTGNLPYIVHPNNVVRYLKTFGVTDPAHIAIAWLHDVLEDTSLTYKILKKHFGKKVAQGVYILSRNVDDETYKRRLITASTKIQFIKLCDILDNIRTLQELSAEGIERKIIECNEFYIPLALKVCPPIARQINHYLKKYTQEQRELSLFPK